MERKTIWLEGAFLRAQHFQQQDRRFAAMLLHQARMAQPFHWGFTDLEIDEDALRSGAVSVRRCTGTFQDGEPFAWPGEMAAKPTVAVPRDCKNAVVYLTAPRAGGRLAAYADGGELPGTRYVIEHADILDSVSGDASSDPVEVGLSNARLDIGTEDAGDRHAVPLARIAEVSGDGVVILDRDFIPTVTHASASPKLSALIGEIASSLANRADALERSGGRGGAESYAAAIDTMLLRVANGKGALFAEMRDAGAHHPELLYRASVELAGELSTFSTGARRAPPFPPYDHDDLAGCFGPVMDVIRSVLSQVRDTGVYPIALERSDSGGFYGPIAPPDLLPDGRFIVVARADVGDTTFRENFPRQTTIASTQQVRAYLQATSRGAVIEALNSTPAGLPPRDGWTYFEVRHDDDAWKDIAASATIAIFEANTFPGLELELWGIRSRR